MRSSRQQSLSFYLTEGVVGNRSSRIPERQWPAIDNKSEYLQPAVAIGLWWVQRCPRPALRLFDAVVPGVVPGAAQSYLQKLGRMCNFNYALKMRICRACAAKGDPSSVTRFTQSAGKVFGRRYRPLFGGFPRRLSPVAILRDLSAGN